MENGLLDNLVEAMHPFVSEESDVVDTTLRRERPRPYPVVAIRETMVNAVVQSVGSRYEEIEVMQYADRIEVQSPGTLWNAMTVEKMVAGQRSSRNQSFVAVLRDYGYLDPRDMGARNKISPLLWEHDAREDHLEVIYVQRTNPVGCTGLTSHLNFRITARTGHFIEEIVRSSESAAKVSDLSLFRTDRAETS